MISYSFFVGFFLDLTLVRCQGASMLIDDFLDLLKKSF